MSREKRLIVPGGAVPTNCNGTVCFQNSTTDAARLQSVLLRTSRKLWSVGMVFVNANWEPLLIQTKTAVYAHETKVSCFAGAL